jgi:KDO2-lipid IV(A) lauroyltransferase
MECGYFFYKLGQDISMGLPRACAYKIASFLADLHYFLSHGERRALFRSLRFSGIGKDNSQIKLLARQIFRNFAKNLVDFFRFGLVDHRFLMRKVKIVGLEHVDLVLRGGRGVLVVTAHLGNWEFGGVIMAQKGYALNAVAWEHKDRRTNNLFIYQRERKAVKVIPLGMALRKCFRVLENNEMLAMVGDRDFSPRGTKVKVEFFGRPAYVPRGPAVLCLKTGATIVPGFTIRNRDDSFTLYFEKPIDFSASGSLENDICTLTQKIINVIEIYVRRYPRQWFMFRDFWDR